MEEKKDLTTNILSETFKFVELKKKIDDLENQVEELVKINDKQEESFLNKNTEYIEEIHNVKNQLLQKNQELEEYTKSFATPEEAKELKTQLERFQRRHGDSQSKLPDIIDTIDVLKATNKVLNMQLTQVTNAPVNQFNTLYWGDNYPALKVLFDYLQKMNCLDINWSYFAKCMCKGDNEKINLKSYTLTKNDFGYLLALIRKYFLNQYIVNDKNYEEIILRKFTIDKEPITANFFRKNIRLYIGAKSIPTTLKKDELDDLSSQISNRYIE